MNTTCISYEKKTELKNQIESVLGKTVTLEPASDCANLLFSAKIEGITYATVYKSFDRNFKPIQIIRYTQDCY